MEEAGKIQGMPHLMETEARKVLGEASRAVLLRMVPLPMGRTMDSEGFDKVKIVSTMGINGVALAGFLRHPFASAHKQCTISASKMGHRKR
jgi:hypothetical protein